MKRTGTIEDICTGPDEDLAQILERESIAHETGLPTGINLVVNEKGELLGTITSGDIRRALLRDISGADSLTAQHIMTRDPIVFNEKLSYGEILDRLPEELKRRGRTSKKFLAKCVLVDSENKPVRVINYHELWEQRVASHRHVVVIGLGYVGLTLALELSREGFLVTGFDVDEARVAALNEGDSYIHEIGLPELLRDQLNNNFYANSAIPDDGDVFIISVGTPVEREREGVIPTPQHHHVRRAAIEVGKHLSRGGLVVLRSTVPLGTTRELVIPILEQQSGLHAGRDFHVAFAPERTAEGKALEELRTLPQVIGGINNDSVEATAALFREMAPTIVRVDSLEAAELVKLINNSFRDLVFSFANQVVQLGSAYNLDIVEVIDAANRGYVRDPIPLPSPGVGGPCLTKDPYIMHHSIKSPFENESLFEVGRRVNDSMLEFVVQSVIQQLESIGKRPQDITVVACGLAFKGNPETQDMRDSTGVEIALKMKKLVSRVIGHDPVVNREDIDALGLDTSDFEAAIEQADVVLFLNNHRNYAEMDVSQMIRQMKSEPIVYDGWHLFSHQTITQVRPCIYMGLGFVRTSISMRNATP